MFCSLVFDYYSVVRLRRRKLLLLVTSVVASILTRKMQVIAMSRIIIHHFIQKEALPRVITALPLTF